LIVLLNPLIPWPFFLKNDAEEEEGEGDLRAD